MKVVILAGGFGTRLSEYTSEIPKPMVQIGNKPILWHIMKIYAEYGFKDFYVALGYKSEIIKNYFLNYKSLNNDFSINLKNGNISFYNNNGDDWNIHLIDTGLKTMTGGRLKRLQKFLKNDKFMLTYGDGLSDIDINKLLKFHKNHKKMITVTAVRPTARFGELEINSNNLVKKFEEKPQLYEGWINGGFFIFEPGIFDLIDNDATLLEREPLERAAKKGELMAYKHDSFWQCMDNKRDYELLNSYWDNGPPWVKKV